MAYDIEKIPYHWGTPPSRSTVDRLLWAAHWSRDQYGYSRIRGFPRCVVTACGDWNWPSHFTVEIDGKDVITVKYGDDKGIEQAVRLLNASRRK